MARYLVSGGAGYIGTHLVAALQQAGHEVVVLGHFSNAAPDALTRVTRLTGQPAALWQGDVRDSALLEWLFQSTFQGAPCAGVYHLAGLKSVAESLEQPQRHLDHNLGGSQTLTRAMGRAGVFTSIYSSTATVYRAASVSPITESAPTGASAHPYAASKTAVERHLAALPRHDARWRIASLRYFNPVGAHPSGLIGEAPRGIPSNLMPRLAQVAAGQGAPFILHGSDYPTADGTAERDYLHISDLVDDHLAAMTHLQRHCGHHVWNLGRGEGESVKAMLAAFEYHLGRAIPWRLGPRRPGDIAAYYADAGRAHRQLGWQAHHDLQAMLPDTWSWQRSLGAGLSAPLS